MCVYVSVCLSACARVLWGEEGREMLHHHGEHPKGIRHAWKCLRQVT